MTKKNRIFIATSLDGFIADANGGIEWLDTFPEINNIDSGYAQFTAEIDALVMGRNTYEKVLSFGIEWPYKKPVFVISRTLTEVPNEYDGKVFLLSGSPTDILKSIHQNGFFSLYIDGGGLIQSFLEEDLIDEMVITIIPVLLGQGFPLFGNLSKMLTFECKESKLFLDAIVQNHFVRKRS